MGWIFTVVKRWFCKHDWDVLGDITLWSEYNKELPVGFKKIYVCKKCLQKRTVRY